MTHRWYLARTEPQAEYLAAQELARDGFEIFFPRVKTSHPRFRHEDEPLFPGYIFIRFGAEAEARPTFRQGHRMLGWVRFGGEIPSVPDDVMAEITRRTDEINGGTGLWRKFQLGEKVRVVSGNMDGIAEVVKEAKSPEAHATVVMQFLGGLVRADVPWQSLRPIEQDSSPRQQNIRRTRGKGRWINGSGDRAAATT